MRYPKNNATSMACQSGAFTQFFFGQICQESKILSSDLRVEFEELYENVHSMKCSIVQNWPAPTFLNFIDLIQTLKIVNTKYIYIWFKVLLWKYFTFTKIFAIWLLQVPKVVSCVTNIQTHQLNKAAWFPSTEEKFIFDKALIYIYYIWNPN